MKIKKISVIFLFLVSAVLCGKIEALTIPEMVTIDQSKTTISQNNLYYIENKSGVYRDHISSPIQYAHVNGISIPVYCYEKNNLAYNSGVYNSDAYDLYKISKLSSPGYIYIMENGFPEKKFTGDNSKDYYITQIAIWWYQDLINGVKDTEDGIMPADFKSQTPDNMINYNDQHGLFKYIKSLAHYAADAVTPSLTLSLATDGFQYSSERDNFQAKIFVNTNGVLTQPVITKSTNISTVNLTKSNAYYNINVPINAIDGMSGEVSLSIEASKNTKTLYLYKTKATTDTDDFQKIIVPFDSTSSKDEQITLKLEKTGVIINKVDENGNHVKGATLRLIDSDGNLIEEWLSDGTSKTIYNLKSGKVILSEVKAPDGYEIMDSITEEIVAGEVTLITAVNKISLSEKNDNKVSIIKLDENGKSLAGAKFELIDSSGKSYTWTSSTSAHVIQGLASGICTLKEIEAPTGYSKILSNINCEIKQNVNNIIKVSNSKNQILISKQDLTTGEELPGATLILKDLDGNQIEKWISTDVPHNVKGLISGKQYILEETVAPDGYALTSSISFFINQNGGVDSPVIMKNELITAKFYKRDSETKEMLKDAELILKDSEGNEIDKWTTTNEPYQIKGLVAGKTYILEEKTAPKGYNKSDSLIFKIDSKKTIQEFTMYDDKSVVQVPDTSSHSSMMNRISSIIVLISGITGVVLYIKKRKSEEV